MKSLRPIHYLPANILNPTDAITVNVIGAGGTGSHLMTALADTAFMMCALGHPGLHVRLFDDDIVTEFNPGRQRFSSMEIGLPKAVAIVNRINAYHGFNWEAIPERYTPELAESLQNPAAMFTFSCVDQVPDRFAIDRLLRSFIPQRIRREYRPYYWMDCGNAQKTGQVIFSTIGKIEQPHSKQFITVSQLPTVTKAFGHLLIDEPSAPSCSHAEAIRRQDLFINRKVAVEAANFFWQFLRNGYSYYHGVLINSGDFVSRPLPIPIPPKPKRKPKEKK